MLSFHSFQIHDLMRAKVTKVGPTITLIVPNLDFGLVVAPDLTPGVLTGGCIWAPPFIQQLLGGLLVMEMSLD